MKTNIKSPVWVARVVGKGGVTLCLTAVFIGLGQWRTDAALYAPATNYNAGSAPVGMWLGNLRGKSTWRDMVIAHSGTNSIGVRLCLDNGTFGQLNTYTVGPNPIAVRCGSFNGDAYEDIVVANYGTNTVSVLINQGFGANFRAATNFVVGSSANPGPKAVTVADVNQDGKVDILVANFNDNSVSVLLGLGGGAFSTATDYEVGTGPSSIYAADFDGDNIVDLLTADYGSDTLTILPGLGDGSFGPAETINCPANSHPSYALAADFNRDGNLDIAVALEGSNQVRVFFYDAGSYSVAADYPVGTGPRSLLLRDLNRDGYPDVAVADSGDDKVRILLGSVSGALTDAGAFSVGDNPAIVVGSNFNGDNAGDLAVANTGSDTVSVLLYGGPMAYDVRLNVLEDTSTPVPLDGRMLGGGALTFITNSLPAHGTLSGPVTNLTYLAETNYFGPDSFQYSTTDGTLTSAVATVYLSVVPVNDPPSFDLAANYFTVREDAATTNIVGVATNLTKGPTNEAGQALAFVVTTTNGAFFASRPFISPSGTLTFRPARNATGTQTMAVQLRDNGGTANGGINLSPVQYFTIEVTPNPIKPVRGTYSGLFFETNGVAHRSSGFFTFTMLASGVFSGKLTAEGIRYPFSGTFGLDGHAVTEILRNNSTLTVNMQLDLTNHSDEVIGTVADGTWLADLAGDRALYHSVTNPAVQAGKYTLIITGNPTNSVISPGGDGYATMTVNSAGVVRVSGKVGDNASFSQSTYLSKQRQWPFYASLYSAGGSVLSWVTVTNTLSGSVTGQVSWFKGASTTRYYPNGFTNLIELIGSIYVAPLPGERVLSVTNGTLTLRGGNLWAPEVYPAILTETNTVYVGSAQYFRLSSPATGLVLGAFPHPALGANRALRGVVLQQQQTVRGNFIGYDQTGSFEFSP